MRNPTKEEMVEGIALGVQRAISNNYENQFTVLDSDLKTALAVGVNDYMEKKPPKFSLKKIKALFGKKSRKAKTASVN